MMQRRQKRRYAIATLLALVSLLAIAPSLTSALQQNGSIAINATGQANPIGKKGTGSPATLSLTGNVQTQGSDPLKLTGLTGTLMIGGTTYPISDGKGEVNNKGTTEINAKSNGNGNHKYELILHGSMQGNNVNFDCPQSKLASQFFLCLSGQVNITTSSSLSPSSASSSSSTASTSTSTEEEAETETVTVTETTSLTSLQNSTVTQNVTQTLNGTTTTVFGNQTITETTTLPQNVTVTTTQITNSTITTTVTSTAANSTITETVTTTVANTTITETTTSTVANTTITILTNSTATP